MSHATNDWIRRYEMILDIMCLVQISEENRDLYEAVMHGFVYILEQLWFVGLRLSHSIDQC